MKNMKIIIIAAFSFLIVNLYNIQIIKNEFYKEKFNKESKRIISTETAPRGRIYDKNGILLVDNIPKKIIFYKKEINMTRQDEINSLKKVVNMINIDTAKITTNILKDYYIAMNDTTNLIKEDEWELYKTRKLSDMDIYKLKLERIVDIEKINKEEAMLYYLMNKGYSYEEKVIKENPSNIEYATIAENLEDIKGFNVKIGFERYYPYGETLKTILGNIGEFTKENEKMYIENGHVKNDIVGTSYLEFQYDKYLRGEKNKYEVYNNNYTLVEEGHKGNDLYLTIDIKLQLEIEKILVEEIKNAQKELNTQYYNKAFAILTEPKTGNILAMTGKMVVDEEVYDNTAGIITQSVTVGSTIKAASQIVGYNNGGLKVGEIRNDQCIKIKSTPEKCSFRYLGTLNDIEALKHSSNTYQFHTAIKVGKGNYIYDGPLSLDLTAFDKYRTTFNQFGLGVKTEIDLPNEKLGFKGESNVVGHLLDFSIGQYDTYTPIQLSQYITTLASNGNRVRFNILKEVKDNNGKTIYKPLTKILNKVETKEEYFNRTLEGLKEVLRPFGTGYNYIIENELPAGKTGTSQSFIDTNNDGKIDTETISTQFVGYAPYTDPKITFTIINPDISVINNNNYVSFITKRITNRISNTYFSQYNN